MYVFVTKLWELATGPKGRRRRAGLAQLVVCTHVVGLGEMAGVASLFLLPRTRGRDQTAEAGRMPRGGRWCAGLTHEIGGFDRNDVTPNGTNKVLATK